MRPGGLWLGSPGSCPMLCMVILLSLMQQFLEYLKRGCLPISQQYEEEKSQEWAPET